MSATGLRHADTVDAALERAGCCHRLRLLVTVACVTACVTNSFSLVCTSLAMPAAEFDLRLTSVQLGLLNGASFVGMLIGALVWGAASDVAGRRPAIVWALAIGAVASLAASAAPAFWLLTLMRCLAGVGSGGSQPALFSYFAEWQPRRVRGPAVSGLSGCWMLGGMFASAVAWLVLPRPPQEWCLFSLAGVTFGPWRLYMATCALPYAAAALVFLVCLPESPMHLFERGKYKEANALLKKLAYRHKTGGNADHDNQSVRLALRTESSSQPGQSLTPRRLLREATTAGRLRSVIAALLDRRRRRLVLLLVGINSAAAFSYYGLLLWFPVLFKRAHQFASEAEDSGSGTGGGIASVCASGNGTAWRMGDNKTSWSASACDPELLAATRPFAEAFLVNASNLPGNVASLLLVNRVGQRRLLSASLALMAASVGLIGVVWSHAQALAFSCAFAAVSAVGWNSISVVSAELLPPRLQASALGLSFALSRISSLLGTVTFGALVDDGCLAPMTLSAGVLVVGALLVCALPGTRRMPLDAFHALTPSRRSSAYKLAPDPGGPGTPEPTPLSSAPLAAQPTHIQAA